VTTPEVTDQPAPPTPVYRQRPVVLAAAVTLVVALALGIRNGVDKGLDHGLVDGVAGGLGSFVGVLLAAGVAALALSLRGRSPEGLLVGIGLPVAAMMAWTHLDKPILIWTVEAVLGLVLVVWTWKWWAEWRELPRMGSFWLAVPVWVLGFISAVGTGHWTVGAQRAVYGGFAVLVTLILFQAWWRRKRDISIGLVVGFLLCHALILVAGADNIFVVSHAVPDTAWGRNMADRFWGGPLLLYHPNFIAMTAVVTAMRIAPDAAFRTWQRWGVLITAGGLLVLTQSRTSMLIAGIASLVWLVLVIWRHPVVRRRLTLLVTSVSYRKVLAKALAPVVVVAVVLVSLGGSGFLFKERYSNDTAEQETAEDEDVPALLRASSGRSGLWTLIGKEWYYDSIVEKAAGNADNARGYILRYGWDYDDGPAPSWFNNQPKLTADNAPVGALRRSGVLGVVALLLGLGLVLWRAVRRGAPIWFTVTAIGMLASILTEDEVLNTAPGWAILVAGEVLVLAHLRRGDTIVEPRPDAPEQVALPVGAQAS
jgi:hypothetical protein